MPDRYLVTLSKRAAKDKEEFKKPAEREKIAEMLSKMEEDPFYLPYEKLVLNLSGKYSRRINIHDRLVYEVRELEGYKGEVYVIRMKGHYKRVHGLLMM